MSEPIILAERSASGRVLTLTLNRPKSLNALSGALLQELNAHLRAASSDDSLACVVLTGGEKVFAAGADITEMKNRNCEWEAGSAVGILPGH
jgi:enoyl-CoA hydratase